MSSKTTKYINFFGGPGVGKSTKSAQYFALLKKQGLEVELVTEVAKDLVWEERHRTLDFQAYVTTKQYRNLKRLQGKVDYVITDGPVLLGQIYAQGMPQCYHDFVLWMHKDLGQRENYLISRRATYNPNGRLQTQAEAEVIDERIKQMLVESGDAFFAI